METYLMDFNFNKVLSYRIQSYCTGNRKESHKDMGAGTKTTDKPSKKYQYW